MAIDFAYAPGTRRSIYYSATPSAEFPQCNSNAAYAAPLCLIALGTQPEGWVDSRTLTFDALGRLVKTIDSAGHVSEYTYDGTDADGTPPLRPPTPLDWDTDGAALQNAPPPTLASCSWVPASTTPPPDYSPAPTPSTVATKTL